MASTSGIGIQERAGFGGISHTIFGDELFEAGEQQIDLRAAGRRAHQHHVVKRRDQHAAIEQIEMQQALQRGLRCSQ